MDLGTGVVNLVCPRLSDFYISGCRLTTEWWKSLNAGTIGSGGNSSLRTVQMLRINWGEYDEHALSESRYPFTRLKLSADAVWDATTEIAARKSIVEGCSQLNRLCINVFVGIVCGTHWNVRAMLSHSLINHIT